MGDILEISWLSQSHSNQLCKGIGRLLDSEDDVGSDFEFYCADSTPIKAHFFVLQIFCRVLENSNCRRICFESSEIQRKDVRCLLEFVYRGKTRVEVERLDAVKRAAQKLRLQTFLDLVEGIQIESIEVEVENETDIENEEELCESLAEDEDKVEKDGDSNSVDRDFTECSEEEEEQKSNVGKHEEKGGIRKRLASKKYNLRSYKDENQNAHLPTEHQMDPNGQVLEKSVKCDQCEYSCATELILKTHLENAHCAADESKSKRRKLPIDSSAPNHKCETCGKCFQFVDYLRQHKLAHAEKVDCEFCGKKFSLRSIWTHRILHKVGGNKILKCIICPFRSRDRVSLKIHIRRKHDMSEEEIGLLVNSQAVRISDEDQPQLLEHLRRQSLNVRSHACETCGKCFRFVNHLRQHKLTHADKVDCEFCGKRFSLRSIDRHRQLHTEVGEQAKKFKCYICPFSCRRQFDLKIHILRKHDMLEEESSSIPKRC